MPKCYRCHLPLIAARPILIAKQLASNESDESDAYSRALKLFTASAIKPDHDLRRLASDYHCYEELMEIRFHCLAYLQSLKEIHQIDAPDESDELESDKIVLEKAAAAGDFLISQ